MWQIFLSLLALANASPIEDDVYRFGAVRYFQPVPNQILPYGTYKSAAPVQFLRAFPSLFRYQAPTGGVPVAPQAVVPVPLTYGVAPRVHVTQVQPGGPSEQVGGPVGQPVAPPVVQQVSPPAVPQSFYTVRAEVDDSPEDKSDEVERRVVIPVQYSVPGVQPGGLVYYGDDIDDDDYRRIALPVQYRAQGVSSPFVRSIYYDDDDDDDDDSQGRFVVPIQYTSGAGVRSGVPSPGIVYAVAASQESLEAGDSLGRVPVQYTSGVGLPYVRAARSIYYGEKEEEEDDDDKEERLVVPVPYSAPVVYAEEPESVEEPDEPEDPEPEVSLLYSGQRTARKIYYKGDDGTDDDDVPDVDDDDDDSARIVVPVPYGAGVYRVDDDVFDDDRKK